MLRVKINGFIDINPKLYENFAFDILGSELKEGYEKLYNSNDTNKEQKVMFRGGSKQICEITMTMERIKSGD